MALKHKLTAAEHAALPDVLKAEYKAEGDSFVIDVEGAEDTGALRRAHERTKEELTEQKRIAKENADKLEALGVDGARKAGDIVTLENSWKTKLANETAVRDATIQTLQRATINSTVEAATASIVSKLTEHGAILSPHVKSRLTAEINPETGAASLRVLDKEGKVSALSPDDLQKEFASDKAFSAIIRVSKASGGGAGGSGGNNGNRSGGSGGQQDADLSRSDPKDLAARITANKQAANGGE